MNKIFGLLTCVLGLLGVGTAPAMAQEVVNVAAIYAKSGEAAQDNLELFEAVRFAADEVNAQAGPHGRKINLMEYDNHSTPIQSRQAAKQAVKDGAVAIIGASWSSHSLAIAPYLQDKKIPMLTPDSTNSNITKVGDYIFRACFDDDYQGKALALFARNYFKAGTAVLLQNISSDYSMGLAQTFQREFTAMGGRILGTLNYKSDCKDFKEALSQVKGLDPDVLFVPGHAESGFVVKQAQTLGLRAKLLGGDGWPYREFYANGGQDLREGYYAAHWNKAVDTPKSQEFVAKYKKVYDVTDFAAISYDAAMVLFDAIRRARDTSPQAIRDALAETRDFEGATGRITFDATGNPVDKPVIIMKIANGRPTMLMTMTPGN